MDSALLKQALIKFLSGVVLVGALLFIPAGTLDFPEAWRFMAVLFIPMFGAGLVMLKYSPELLRRRLDAKESQGDQRAVIAASGLMFIAVFVIAGLNRRFSWIVCPGWISRMAAAIFLIGYVLFARVLAENEYLSRTIRVQAEQKLVDTGLYGVVRHPMYLATVLMFLAMPLVLGSPISFAIMLIYPLLIAKRIEGEERVLEAELEGYADYKRRVKWRMIPFVW